MPLCKGGTHGGEELGAGVSEEAREGVREGRRGQCLCYLVLIQGTLSFHFRDAPKLSQYPYTWQSPNLQAHRLSPIQEYCLSHLS